MIFDRRYRWLLYVVPVMSGLAAADADDAARLYCLEAMHIEQQRHVGASAIDAAVCKHTELSSNAWQCVAQSMLEHSLSLHQAMTGCGVSR